MRYLRYIPRPPLSEFVELLWLFENVASHASERVLPTGSVELVINLHAETSGSFDGVIAGPHFHYFVLDTSRPVSVIGVHFKPGGAPPFFALPLDELCNQHVPLHLLWGTVASELRERLLAAETDRAKLVLLEHVLLRMLQRRPSGDVAVRYALAAFGRGNRHVGDVVNEIGMSQRRFIRLFRDEVGLTPKAFCRIRRFQRAVSMLHSARTVDWADTALACGYCDQSHMIHDFQAIAGLSPTHYFSRRSTHMNHVPSPEP